jgi:hypothetical protein
MVQNVQLRIKQRISDIVEETKRIVGQIAAINERIKAHTGQNLVQLNKDDLIRQIEDIADEYTLIINVDHKRSRMTYNNLIEELHNAELSLQGVRKELDYVKKIERDLNNELDPTHYLGDIHDERQDNVGIVNDEYIARKTQYEWDEESAREMQGMYNEEPLNAWQYGQKNQPAFESGQSEWSYPPQTWQKNQSNLSQQDFQVETSQDEYESNDDLGGSVLGF